VLSKLVLYITHTHIN